MTSNEIATEIAAYAYRVTEGMRPNDGYMVIRDAMVMMRAMMNAMAVEAILASKDDNAPGAGAESEGRRHEDGS